MRVNRNRIYGRYWLSCCRIFLNVFSKLGCICKYRDQAHDLSCDYSSDRWVVGFSQHRNQNADRKARDNGCAHCE